MAYFLTTGNNNVAAGKNQQRIWKKPEPSCTANGIENGAAMTENSLAIPQAIKSYHMTQQFLSKVRYLRNENVMSTQKLVGGLFMATVFPTAKRWKRLKCPSTDKWINKMWQSHVMEYLA